MKEHIPEQREHAFVEKSKDDYNTNLLQEIELLEKESFWYRGRRDLIVWAITHYFDSTETLLEIGGGTGFVLYEIKRTIPSLKVLAGDIYTQSLRYVKKRLPAASPCQLDIRHIPFKTTLDIIGAFDVLEHIQEDRTALHQIFQAVHPAGGIILTVPQHPFLWSSMDEISQHKRRYTRKEFVDNVKKAGFSILRVTSFGTLVFPLKMLEVFIRYAKKKLHMKDECIHIARLPKFINDGIYLLMKIENFLIRNNISFPFGSSLLIVAKKSNYE